MKHGFLALGVVVALVLVAGCATSGELTTQQTIIRDQIQELDSLDALNRQLFAELGLLRDSLQFIDDIETGQYYRDMRALEERIRRLEFALYQQDRGITIAELPADRLFEPASANLKDTGKELLDSVAVLVIRDFPTHLLRIEGHADNSPLGPSLVELYGSNWGLSTARAASVIDYLVETHALEPSRMAAVGYGSTRPIASNDTQAGRRQNRRVRVAAVPLLDAEARTSESAEP